MADLDLADRLADHNQFCAAKRRFYAPLAGLCWIASYAIAALLASLLGLSDAAFHLAIGLALALLALDGWWQVQASVARDAHRLAIAAGAQPTPADLAARRAWTRRGLLPADGPDPLRTALRVLCAAPRLSASAWRAPEETLPWTHGDVARATGLLRRLAAAGDGWQPVAAAGDDADLLPGLETLEVLEARLGASGGEVRVPPALWLRHFKPAKPAQDVFVLPQDEG